MHAPRLRFCLPACALVLACVACRPADPLDWKISAKTPAKFEEWQSTDLRRLPEREQQEFNRAFNFYASTSPRGLAPKDMDETNNPLCRRLHGRTIRHVILEGYDLERRTLAARISTESDNIIRNAEQTAKIDDPATLQRFEKVRNLQLESIEKYKARLAEIAQRVKELSAPAS
jgi:hypothetical protein